MATLLGYTATGLDRTLLAAAALTLQEEAAGRSVLDEPARRDLRRRQVAYHAMLRRKSYFERLDSGWREMLPYRHLDAFLQLTANPTAGPGVGIDPAADPRANIAAAISTAEGLHHPTLGRESVVLRAAGDGKAGLKSFRLFPLTDFRLQVPTLHQLSAYLEYIPDRLYFEHTRAPVRLTIALDLFELLAEIGAGGVPAPADLQGAFLNLTIFKNALTHLSYREVLITDDDRQFYRIWADPNNILYMASLPQEVGDSAD
jgi:hypothetical protein